MGQGLYTAIVWGAIVAHPDELYYDIYEQLTLIGHKSIWCSYECRQAWVGVMLADSDGNINTYFDPLDPLDPYKQKGLCFYKQAFKLSELREQIENANPNAITQAKKDWDKFSRAMKEAGVELPDPDFLLINDWD